MLRRCAVGLFRRQTVCVLALAGLAATVCVGQASAQFAGNSDGYAPDGSYRLQVELTPYLWLPATSTNFSLGPRGGINGSTSTGLPTAAQLANTLHGAFMGFGLLRYGPWSTELDLDWVTASAGKTATGPLGNTLHLSTSATLLRIAPGFGYEAVRGEIAGMPVTVDARAGFAVFTRSDKISALEVPTGVSDSGSFVQPWLGTRVSLYPGTDWRIDIGALGQGFGVNGGSWGWGASLMAAYSVTSWMDVTGGFRALSTSRSDHGTGPFGSGTRSLNLTAYGPVLGVGFRF